MRPVVILGTGMAGLGAAHALASRQIASVCFDLNPVYGGHTASRAVAPGFVFDNGPHISFTKDSRFQRLLVESLGEPFEASEARINNYWHGHWLTHPVECNLHGLPVELVVKVIQDFLDARQSKRQDIHNYADWLDVAYGKTFADAFPKGGRNTTRRVWTT